MTNMCKCGHEMFWEEVSSYYSDSEYECVCSNPDCDIDED